MTPTRKIPMKLPVNHCVHDIYMIITKFEVFMY